MLNRKKPLERKAFKKKARKSTGELKLFIELYAKQGGKCIVSGENLLPPEHPMFYKQGSHCLPKNTYPEWRLREENVLMMRPEFHDQWPLLKEKPESVLNAHPNPQWKVIVPYFWALRAHVYAPSLSLPKKPQVPKKP